MITVTIHPEDVLEDGDCRSFIDKTRDGYFTLQERIRVDIIDEKCRYAVISELRKDMAEGFN